MYFIQRQIRDAKQLTNGFLLLNMKTYTNRQFGCRVLPDFSYFFHEIEHIFLICLLLFSLQLSSNFKLDLNMVCPEKLWTCNNISSNLCNLFCIIFIFCYIVLFCDIVSFATHSRYSKLTLHGSVLVFAAIHRND